MKKIAIVSFQGELPCFVHALLNTWNYHERGYETALIIEGASTSRIGDIASSPQRQLWEKIKEQGLIRSVCKAAQGLPIDASLSGHSDLEAFTAQGFEIILF